MAKSNRTVTVAAENPVNTEAANNAGETNLPTVSDVKSGEVSSQFNVNMKMTLEQADKAINEIVKSGSKLRKLVHETACGILFHYAEHGDYTRLRRPLKKTASGRLQIDDSAPTRLYEAIREALSASMQRAFVEWVIAYSSLRWNDETKTFYHYKRDKRIPKDKRGFVDMACIDTPFWSMEREPEGPKAMTVEQIQELIIRTVSRLVTLEVEKRVGKSVGRGDDKKVHKIKHQIDDQMVIDLIAFAEEHGVPVAEQRAELLKAGIQLQ